MDSVGSIYAWWLHDEGLCWVDCKLFREERDMREADEKEEREFRLLLEMEENKTKQREYATEQVRQVKVSTVTVQFSLIVTGFG